MSAMKEHHCVTQEGEHFLILQDEEGSYLCPVCGSPEFTSPPYYPDGAPSFQMCSCGFEFGFDDSNAATRDAVEGIVNNWNRWRIDVIQSRRTNKAALKELEANLEKIGYKLAFDLIPVPIDDNT